MRIVVTVLIALAALITANPADAQSRQRVPTTTGMAWPFMGFWGQPAAPRGRVAARSGGTSTSTACLPGRLKAALADVQRRYGPVTVVSTMRRGARIGGGRPSMHASCQAVDFKPARGTYAQVAAHLRRTWHGGMGTYSSGHIHIDTGENYRWHTGGGSYARR